MDRCIVCMNFGHVCMNVCVYVCCVHLTDGVWVYRTAGWIRCGCGMKGWGAPLQSLLGPRPVVFMDVS